MRSLCLALAVDELLRGSGRCKAAEGSGRCKYDIEGVDKDHTHNMAVDKQDKSKYAHTR